jgi:class 3 adenylate cyclase/DNA-binding CsgD family transcriptional regulator/tetratricopeptide (TPR) repeat protein
MRDSGGVVAILFTDLVGSTEVLDRLGDDAAEELRRTHFSLLREVLAQTGGTEVKTLGDGLMASFASPVQAVTCAVGMQQTIAEHNRAEPKRVLQVRIGLHAGDPVRDEDDFHGTAVVVAKRLCDQADGGQILASDLVAALVGTRGDFRFRPAGHRKLKGLSQPTAAVTVAWRDAGPSDPSIARALRGRGSGPDSPQPPARALVGRQPELDRIQQAVADAATGRGRVVFVVGQMGIGKTRLVEEALGRARRGGVAVLVGRTPPAGSGLAYAPLLSAFGTSLRSLDPVERDELIGDLPHLGRLWPEFGLPAPAPVQDADLERALLFEAVARLLDRLSADSPVLLFVDDVHWADGPSLALLGYLVPTVAALPITVVGTYRPEGLLENKALRQFVMTARRAGMVSEVPLRGLDGDEVAELATGLLGDTPPAPLLELSRRAAGTPLFVEAWIRGLLDAGALVRTADGWTLVGDHPTALPRSVQELVVDRLDLLGQVERSTVELISHGAQGLPHDLLQRAGTVDADELLAVVGRLVEAGLVVQDDEGPDVVYRLAHPLIQEVAVANLPAMAGRRLHARLAETVEAVRPRDLDRLAYHYSRAGYEVDRVRALEVLLEAGERAHNLAAHDDAARHYGAALPLIRDGQRPELLAQVLERLGESWEPLGEAAVASELWTEALGELERRGDVEGVARLHRRLAFAGHAGGDMPSASRHVAAGIDALRELPPSEQLADLHAARLYIELGLSLGDLEWGHDAVAELTRLGEALNSPRVQAQARLSALQVTFVNGYAGPADRLLSWAEEARRIAEDAGEWALARRIRRELGWVHVCVLGDAAAMRENALAQIDLDRRLGDIAHQSTALQQLGYASLMAGDLDASVSYGEEAVAQARRYDQRRTLAICLGVLALARVHRGELAEARDLLTEAWQVIPLEAEPRAAILVVWPDAMLSLESGDPARVLDLLGPYHHSVTRNLLGMAQVSLGDLEGARMTAELLAGMSPPGLYPSGLADRLFGLIAHARGESDVAVAHLQRSIATLEALHLPFDVAVSRLHVGTAEQVRQALAAFETLGATRYADRARRALRGLGFRQPSRRRPRGAEEPLSRREMEVATLVAQGLTNAEIADRLVVSVRTVESHLDHVYTRLGLSSRVALAQWVTSGGQAASAT